MENVLPRWEWRTFGDGFGDAESRVKAFTPDKVREGAEIYILSAVSNDNTKIRDMLMDIKTLQQVNEDGLEQRLPGCAAAVPPGRLHARAVHRRTGEGQPSPACNGCPEKEDRVPDHKNLVHMTI